MSSYKPADSKREEFRKYLDRSGVMDTLTKALVKLYEEDERPSPEDAMGYILKQLNGLSNTDYEEFAKIHNIEEKVAGMPDKNTNY